MNSCQLNTDDEESKNHASSQDTNPSCADFLPRQGEMSLSLDSFFESCRLISESGHSISAAVNEITQFKKMLSEVLQRPIETIEALQSGIKEITPLLVFWREYGNRFSKLITCPEDAEKVLNCYDGYPELKQNLEILKHEIKEKDARIASLEESEINKHFRAEQQKTSELQAEIDEFQKKLAQSQTEFEEVKKDCEILKNENQSLLGEKESISKENKALQEKNVQEQKVHQEEIEKANKDYKSLTDELEAIKKQNAESQEIIQEKEDEIQRLSEETKVLKEKSDQELSAHQEEIEKANKAYRIKTEEIESLRHQIANYQIVRGLIADAFRIDMSSASELDYAVSTTKKILCACMELDKKSSVKDSVIEHFEEIIKDNARLKEQEKQIASLEKQIESQRQEIDKKDTDLYDLEQKNNSMVGEIDAQKFTINRLSKSEQELLERKKLLEDSLMIRNSIIQCFKDISDDFERIINIIENQESSSEELQRLKKLLTALCIQNNRMVELDELAKGYGIARVDVPTMTIVFTKFNAFDKTKQFHDIYLVFIENIMSSRGMQWSSSYGQVEQEHILGGFSQEYKRILTLCQAFEDIEHSKNNTIELDRFEAHQSEMLSAINSFFQYAKKSTNGPALDTGTTLYEKTTLLPNVQERLSQAIEAAVFSINYSQKKIEEFDELQKAFNDLQHKYEKQCNVLSILGKKMYPSFMTSQGFERRDKLIDDIEYALSNDSTDAIALKSYLGLLSFVEKHNETPSDDTITWILKQIPKALYIFYQNTILEGDSDIRSDEAIYNVMYQLMNRINKFILKDNFFLSIPRLGAPISLDSMDVLETTTSVNAVISWRIYDSHRNIISKALVK